MNNNWKKTVFRRAVAVFLCVLLMAAVVPGAFAAGSTTVVTPATTQAGIDWGHGVTTDVVLEWAVTIACCMAVIFGVSGVVVAFVLEKKK